jgi:hypothetical protein
MLSLYPLYAAVKPLYYLNLHINPKTIKNVHLNYPKSLPTSPYLNGKVCHIIINIIIKIPNVTTI